MRLLGIFLVLTMGSSSFANSLIDQIDSGVNDRTDVLAIYKDGNLIYEEFRNGYERNQKHKLWSMSKSITSLLVARAVQQGRVDIKSSICNYVSAAILSDMKQCQITPEDLLFWQSKIEWAEKYIGWDGGSSNVLTGLYGKGINNFANYFFSLPYKNSVEHNWNYSTGDSHILSYLLRSVYSPVEYDGMPWTELFDPLGIKDVTFERDHDGTFLGGSYIYLSHPSLNKIAQFVIDEITYPTETPADWWSNVLRAKPDTEFTLKMAEDAVAPAIPGGHWWLNRPTNLKNQDVPWPKAPADTFAAFGVFGQMMFIIPSEDLVIIRLAQDVKGGFDRAKLLEVSLDYAKEWIK